MKNLYYRKNIIDRDKMNHPLRIEMQLALF